MLSISAIVLTRDEERHIAACLNGLRWAQEVVLLDSLSRDRTREIAGAFTDKIYQRPFTTFANQRNTALALAQNEWVFFLDADERVSPALAAEIQAAISSPRATGTATSGGELPDLAGYWIPRRNCILGHWVGHGGWHPDHQLRLFRRSLGRYDESRDPHETVMLQGPAGYLLHPIIHYNYLSFGQIFAKQLSYAAREAKTLHRAGQRQKARWYVSQPVREFLLRYVGLEGYKDGFLGLFLSLMMAWYRLKVGTNLARLGAGANGGGERHADDGGIVTGAGAELRDHPLEGPPRG